MLEKLLRARLPEQIVALIEKLEQDPDASHLNKVVWLMDNAETVFTRYERWALKRAVRKCRNVLRREKTLNRVMRIVINDPAEEKISPAAGLYGGAIQGAGMSLTQQSLHQQLMGQSLYNSAQNYASQIGIGSSGQR